MSLNHHLLAKATTEAVLANFKSGMWKSVNGTGSDFYRINCDSTFPSPDAAFKDDTQKLIVSFEFKPPTETKRGILTGLGQSIAYLESSNLSYLIIPQRLEDFDIGGYMTDLFKSQIEEKLPVGLIIYENDLTSNVKLIHNVNKLDKKIEFDARGRGRFWAKQQDLPIPLFHLLLHYYYLKRISQSKEDAFAKCWNERLVPPTVLTTLFPVIVYDIQGNPIKTQSNKTNKNIAFFEKLLAPVRKLNGAKKADAISKLVSHRDSNITSGDNNYQSTRKNFVTFMKHLGVIDSTGNITDYGFKLYHLGLVNGPHSKLFVDYFTQAILTVGHHVDLIFDLDNLCNKYRGKESIDRIKEIMENDYEARGMIKRNPKKVAGKSITVPFLRYEFLLWNSLNLLVKTNGTPEISFNWKRITEVCSLPDM